MIEHAGRRAFVCGSYGSCSGCDSFEAEFGFNERETCGEHVYDGHVEARKSCAACQRANKSYQDKLVNFGKPYLEGSQTGEMVLKVYAGQSDWDSGTVDMLAWVSAMMVKHGTERWSTPK